MTRYRVLWPMLTGLRTHSSTKAGTVASVSAYADQLLPPDVVQEDIDRLLADGAIRAVEFVDEAA